MEVDFLTSRMSQPWMSDRTGAECEFYYGKGNHPLEVVVTERQDRPRKDWLVRTYRDRRGQRVSPVLLVVLRDGRETVDICGPVGEENPPVKRDLDPDQIRRIADTALDEPDRFAAQRFLDEVLEQVEDELVGLRNRGLLSTHVLKVRVPDRTDWERGANNGQDVLDSGGQDIAGDLGYDLERLTDQSYVLKDASDGRESAVAVFLEDEESFDHTQDRFTGQTPVSYALNEADKKNLEYVIANSDGMLRLYTTNPDAGFGSRGRTDTFVEVNTDLLTEDNAAYVWLLFSSSALRSEGSLQEIMEDSKDYAAALGKRLRERIYEDVIPGLAEAIAQERDLENPTKEELDETYEMTLVQLYRLLFIAYAEDEGFLPRHNPRYDKRSLKQKAHELHDVVEEGVEFDANAADHWVDVMRLTEAIHDGRNAWSLPAYDGRLLSSDEDVFDAGGKLAEIELTDDQFGPVLANLLIDETEDGYEGPVDFRNVGVREFGVIYEGLLESELSVANRDLTIDEEGHYVPVETGGQQTLGGDDVEEVAEGEVYLHGQSGERKATGTYYTKTRFVEHLLDHSLEPALDEHVERLERLAEEEDEHAVADAFFDLRVADIAMGSGHFLVGAVDRIERKLMTFLSQHDVTPVEQELDRLRGTAEDAFESSAEMPEVERSQLLRRQVARRCVFGVDLNSLATELARLSIWVHTFVPGLPLTFLDYNLTTGDSLAGIGTLDEVGEILDVEQKSLDMFMDDGSDLMEELEGAIEALGRLADADAEQIEEARNTRYRIERQLAGPRAAFDILAASRIDDGIDPGVVEEDGVDLRETDEYERARDVLESTNPLHFPAAFPEVFMGENAGFDVIVGNPPWEKTQVERHEFWARYHPGLRGMTQREREEVMNDLEEERPDLRREFEQQKEMEERRAKILTNGPYPGIGQSHPDLYKAFSWRFWHLLTEQGHVGVVLPRTTLVGPGMERFREMLLEEGTINDLTFLVNNRKWVFPDLHPQYTIALISWWKHKREDSTLPLRGPFPDEESFKMNKDTSLIRFSAERAKRWAGSATIPILPATPDSVGVFNALEEHPRLDDDTSRSWQAHPYQEFNATQDKKRDDGKRIMHFIEDPPENYWPVFKGESFDIWDSDTGQRYAWVDPDIAVDYAQEKRVNSYEYAGSRSPFADMPEEWIYDKNTLPCHTPRIAFRDVTRSTDSRTMRTALVPPKLFLTHKAPTLVWPRGEEKDEAYLLGILSSIPLDWYARRFVEITMTFGIFNSFPIPSSVETSELRQRVIKLSGRLAAVDDRYAEWADAVGVEYGPLDEDEKQDMIYELDAVVAHLYGLTREHLQVVFETFHDGWDHEPRMEAVLEYYDEWAERLDSAEHDHLASEEGETTG